MMIALMNLYDMIKELLRIQSRQDTLHQTEMLQTIADSIGTQRRLGT